MMIMIIMSNKGINLYFALAFWNVYCGKIVIILKCILISPVSGFSFLFF